jgi:putative ABC transport system permease protein
MTTATERLPRRDRSRLPAHELVAVALQGLRSRRLRAALSALGIAIGIGAMVAVVGVSSTAQANLIAEIDRLGTNLLTVSPGQDLLGNDAVLPDTAGPMIDHMQHVETQAAIYQVSSANVYRTKYIPAGQTGGIGVDATDDNLPQVVGTSIASGHFLNAVSSKYPEVVLGSRAAATLEITNASGHMLVDIGNRQFSVIGILKPVALAASLDSEAFISLPVAEQLFDRQPNASEIYIRSSQDQVTQVSNLLPPTANPGDPGGVSVNRPSNLLEARAAAKGQFTSLLLGLGAVALLVGAIGIANIMVISVLERRGEIGLRRALGATRRHIRIEFLAESAVLAAIGGVAGLALGAGASEIYAQAKHEPYIVPLYALIAAPASGLLIGTLAGLYPATKAARLSPTEALRAE